MSNLKDRMDKVKSIVSEYAGQRKRLQEQAQDWRSREKQYRKTRKDKERALAVVRQVANETLDQLNYQLTEPVSLALQSVFDNPYEFKMAFTPRRNQTECDIWFERYGAKRNPLDAAGGGTADIAAFGVQAALLALKSREDGTSPVLILDEPFKHLKGQEANRRAIEMVKQISDQLSIQIIMVSDERAAQEDIEAGADKVFYCDHDGEKTVIKEK